MKTVRASARSWLLGALFLTGACAQPFQNRAQNVTVVPARIAALPAFTMAYELGFNEEAPTPVNDWADAMAASLNPEINRWVLGNRGHAFAETDTMMVPVTYRKFRKWTALALAEIAAQQTGHRDFKLYSVDKWAFGQNLDWLRTMVDADFVLVTLFKDTRRTTGHVVGNVLIGRHFFYLQVGVACLVDLRNEGQMVWCNTRKDSWQDMSVPANASAAIGELLTNLYYPSTPAQPPHGPPPTKH